MKTQLTLTLTGAFRADLDDVTLRGLSRRTQAMLAFLATQRDMRTEPGTLATLLWPDRTEEQARASLRQELSVARRVIGADLLEADRQSVWLNAAQVRSLRDEDESFMQGFDLASEPFEDWLRQERLAPSLKERPAARPVRDVPAVAVLPFRESGVAQTDNFAEGIVEEITGALSRVGDFDVIARQSAFALQGHSIGAQEAARRLGANYLVEGTVRRAGERVRVTVQLVRGRDAHTVWSARFDDRLDDLFDMQDRIAMQVAGQLSPTLRQSEIDRASALPPEHRSAYSLTLSALPHFWAHRREDNAKAISILDQAIDHSPYYAPAIAYRAWAVAQEASYIWTDDPAAARQDAEATADRAAQLTQTHVGSLVAISAAYSLVTDKPDVAAHFVEKALAIDPNNAWGWMRTGWVRLYQERRDEAFAAFDRAETLSPLDPFRFNMMIGRGMCHVHDNELELGLEELTNAVTAAPGLKWAYRLIASVNQRLGRSKAAQESMRELLEAYPGLTLERLIASVPPTLVELNKYHYSALVEAGLPER